MLSGLPPKADLPILELLPPPALGERRHRGLARRLVAVRRHAVLMVAKGQRPHPRRALRCRVHLHDAADDCAVGENVEVVVGPLARRARGGRALEDQGQGPSSSSNQSGSFPRWMAAEMTSAVVIMAIGISSAGLSLPCPFFLILVGVRPVCTT